MGAVPSVPTVPTSFADQHRAPEARLHCGSVRKGGGLRGTEGVCFDRLPAIWQRHNANREAVIARAEGAPKPIV
jgi:hypothetical protein